MDQLDTNNIQDTCQLGVAGTVDHRLDRVGEILPGYFSLTNEYTNTTKKDIIGTTESHISKGLGVVSIKSIGNAKPQTDNTISFRNKPKYSIVRSATFSDNHKEILHLIVINVAPISEIKLETNPKLELEHS